MIEGTVSPLANSAATALRGFIGKSTEAGFQAEVLNGTLPDGSVDLCQTDIDVVVSGRAVIARARDLLFREIGETGGVVFQCRNSIWGGEFVIGAWSEGLVAIDLMPGIFLSEVGGLSGKTYFDQREKGHLTLTKARQLKKGLKDSWEQCSQVKCKIRKLRAIFGLAWLTVRGGLVTARRGVMVAVLGPDGVGKTTLLDAFTREYSENRKIFSVDRFHFRPGLIKGLVVGSGVTNKTPHAVSPRGPTGSLLKELFLVTDFLVGYYLRVLPLLLAGHIVLYDRYFYDILVDRVRHRLKKRSWVSFIGVRIIPKPDLVIILSAEADAIRTRKRELSSDALHNVSKGYADLVRNFPNLHIRDINAGANQTEVYAAFLREFIQIRARQEERCSRIWNRPGR